MAGYKWTCPYCGKSRVNTSGNQNAIAALRLHIRASKGNGHGPRNDLPRTDELTVSEYVVPVEDEKERSS